MGFWDLDAEEMLEIYLLETEQLLEQMNGVLLAAEKNNAFSEEDIHAVFRVMHTIKSSSAMMGLEQLSSMAHRLEDLFSFYRENFGKLDNIPPALFDLLFAAYDFIAGELEKMDKPDYSPADTKHIETQVSEFLERLMSGGTDAAAPTEVTDDAAVEEDEVKQQPVTVPEAFRTSGGTIVRIVFEEGCRMENIRAFMLVRQISSLCTVLETFPADLDKNAEAASYIKENGVFIRFVSDKKDEVLEALGKGLFVGTCQLLSDTPEAAEAPEKDEILSPAAEDGKKAEFLSVRSDRLDNLQNLTGEMMIYMLTLEDELDQAGLGDIKEGVVHQLNRLIAEAEHNVMAARLVPVKRIFPKFQRILRDICREQEKEAELILSGGELEADKSVVDYMSEALVHIMRNALDHGIETVQERLDAGKPQKGRITLTVEGAVGQIKVVITDDGRGFDADRILKKAKRMGILTRSEKDYSLQEIYELVLHPGFTTNETVTEYSGRGVGLDVVNKLLNDAGGHIYISSKYGAGSTFTLTMPLNMATMECVRFRVAGYRFSLPARYVFRFLDYEKSRENIRRINEQEYIMYEDRMVPLIDLRRYFRMGGEAPDNSMVIYVRTGENEGCIIVDAMYEQKRIVIKPLPALCGPDFRRNTGLCGCSIMGSGKICSALDVEILISRYIKEGTYGF